MIKKEKKNRPKGGGERDNEFDSSVLYVLLKSGTKTERKRNREIDLMCGLRIDVVKPLNCTVPYVSQCP